jgi:hypothetical protein
MTEGPRFQIEIAQTDDSTKDIYVVFDENTGNFNIDYSQYYERMASAVEEIRDIINGTQEVTGGGIPFKDVYAALSYSGITKVLTEEELASASDNLEKAKSDLESNRETLEDQEISNAEANIANLTARVVELQNKVDANKNPENLIEQTKTQLGDL